MTCDFPRRPGGKTDERLFYQLPQVIQHDSAVNRISDCLKMC